MNDTRTTTPEQFSGDTAQRIWLRAAEQDGRPPINLPTELKASYSAQEILSIGQSCAISQASLTAALEEERRSRQVVQVPGIGPAPEGPVSSDPGSDNPAPGAPAPDTLGLKLQMREAPGSVALPPAERPRAAAAAPPAERRGIGSGLVEAFRPNGSAPGHAMKLVIAAEIALLFLLWSLAPGIIPGPLETLASFPDLIQNQGLVVEFWTSLVVFGQSLLITAALCLALGFLSVVPAARPLLSIASALRFLSLAGLVFVFTFFTPNGHWLKVSLLVFGMSVFTLPSFVHVILNTPQERIDDARTLRFGEWELTWEVRIRGNIDELLAILQTNAAIGWLMLTAVEGLVRSAGGVGAMLLAQNKQFILAAVFAIQFLILFTGVLQDYLWRIARSIVAPYTAPTHGHR
jgi:NitT/TauT family transport system permease protein